MTLTMNGSETLFEFGQVAKPADHDGGFVVHQIRDTFLDLDNPVDCRGFFEQVGPFRAIHQFGKDGGATQITWTEVMRWQEVFRHIMQFGWLRFAYTATSARYDLPHDLLETVEKVSAHELTRLGGLPPDVSITAKPAGKDARAELAASISVESILEAITASLYVDTLNGVRYRLCALPDCRKLYEVTSGHEREYCEKAHAHLASVRRRRAEAKAALLASDAAKTTAKQAGKRKARQP